MLAVHAKGDHGAVAAGIDLIAELHIVIAQGHIGPLVAQLAILPPEIVTIFPSEGHDAIGDILRIVDVKRMTDIPRMGNVVPRDVFRGHDVGVFMGEAQFQPLVLPFHLRQILKELGFSFEVFLFRIGLVENVVFLIDEVDAPDGLLALPQIVAIRTMAHLFGLRDEKAIVQVPGLHTGIAMLASGAMGTVDAVKAIDEDVAVKALLAETARMGQITILRIANTDAIFAILAIDKLAPE
jgi:hypothetical protein